MGAREEVEKKIGDKPVTQIVGQPSERDVTLLTKELGKLAASVKTSLGGGKHGHLGLVIEETKYTGISDGSKTFDIPAHPGSYPSTVSADAATREKEIAEHKASVHQCETCEAVHEILKEKAIDAVDEEWCAELEDDMLGFTNVSLIEILAHLRDRGGKLDYIDIAQLKKERDSAWDTNEHIVKHISKVQKAVDILADRAKIKTDEGELLNDLLFTIKASGEMEQALVDWDAKDSADKNWKNAKAYFTKEYANRNKHAAIEAKQAGYGSSANQLTEEQEEAEEQALAAEILAQIRANDSNAVEKMLEQQQKMLESNQKLMTQLMQTIMSNGGAGGTGGAGRAGGARGTGGAKGAGGDFKPPPEWQTTKKGDTTQMYDKTWWWCPNHNDGKGMYVRHKPENHAAWKAAKEGGGAAFREQE
jgi:hypothetical protein